MDDERRYNNAEIFGEAFRRLVLDRLESVSNRLDDTIKSMTELKIEMAVLRTKIAVFVAVGSSVCGGIVSVIVALIMHGIR